MNKEDKATLKIHRLPNLRGKIRNYSIFIDRVKVSSIKDDEAVDIPLSPGHHEVMAKIDWQRSNIFGIDVISGQTVRLRIGREQIKGKKLYTIKGICILMIFIGAVFSPGLIGAGVVGLLMNPTGKIKIF